MNLRRIKSLSAVAASMLTLAACGGGSAEPVTVFKPLAPAAGYVGPDGYLILSLFPAPDAPVLAQRALAAAGVVVLGRRCALERSAPGAGTAGGTSTSLVIFDIAAGDLDAALALHFALVTPAIAETFTSTSAACFV